MKQPRTLRPHIRQALEAARGLDGQGNLPTVKEYLAATQSTGGNRYSGQSFSEKEAYFTYLK